jgi:hypothetical protein
MRRQLLRLPGRVAAPCTGNWPPALRNGCHGTIARLWRERRTSPIPRRVMMIDESRLAGKDSLRPCAWSIVKCPSNGPPKRANREGILATRENRRRRRQAPPSMPGSPATISRCCPAEPGSRTTTLLVLLARCARARIVSTNPRRSLHDFDRRRTAQYPLHIGNVFLSSGFDSDDHLNSAPVALLKNFTCPLLRRYPNNGRMLISSNLRHSHS